MSTATGENLPFTTLHVIYKSGSGSNRHYFQNHLENYLSQLFSHKLVVLPEKPGFASGALRPGPLPVPSRYGLTNMDYPTFL